MDPRAPFDGTDAPPIAPTNGLPGLCFRGSTAGGGVMTPRSAAGVSTCHVLREDSFLAEGISPGRRERAEETCVARTLKVSRGQWTSGSRDHLLGGFSACSSSRACSCGGSTSEVAAQRSYGVRGTFCVQPRSMMRGPCSGERQHGEHSRSPAWRCSTTCGRAHGLRSGRDRAAPGPQRRALATACSERGDRASPEG